MAGYRILRINKQLQEELAALIMRETEDPRLTDTMITITRVDAAKDLYTANVYYTVMDTNNKKRAAEGLKAATGFFIERLRKTLSIRYIPRFTFIYDEETVRMYSLMNTISKIERERKEGAADAPNGDVE